MIVYVETNYILESALVQEDYSACDELLQLAEAAQLTLVVPAFSLAETYSTVLRRHSERRDLQLRLSKELHLLGRTQPYKAQQQTFDDLTSFLVKSTEEEKDRVNDVRRRILAAARIVPLTADVISGALDYETKYDLSAPDALVHSSVMADLQRAARGPKCFLNKNKKDFSVPEIETELDSFDCKLIPSFVHGLQFIRSI